jgi:hypothetical protein
LSTNLTPSASLDPRRANNLLVKSGYRHVVAPIGSGHDLGPSRQPQWNAIDGLFLPTIDHTANHPVTPHPVEMTIFPAQAFGAHLPVKRQAPEVPIDIIRRSNVAIQGVVMLLNITISRIHFIFKAK